MTQAVQSTSVLFFSILEPAGPFFELLDLYIPHIVYTANFKKPEIFHSIYVPFKYRARLRGLGVLSQEKKKLWEDLRDSSSA